MVASRGAWCELADEPDSALPSPALHGATVAGCAIVVAAVGGGIIRSFDFSTSLRVTLAASVASIGTTAAAISLVPRWLGDASDTGHTMRLSRYAATASLPLAASGLFLPLAGSGRALPRSVTGLVDFLPKAGLVFTAIAALSALAYYSGLLGARVFLDLSGFERHRVAGLTTLVAALPALLAASLCVAR